MVVRRKVPPYIAHIIWDAIRICTHNRQLANHGRLSKHLQRERPELSITEAEQHVTNCIDEGIIIAAPKGFGPQSYVLPSADFVRTDGDSHDWYCIECHLPGDVEFCQKCPRVFHKDCQKKNKNMSKLAIQKILNSINGKKGKKNFLNEHISQNSSDLNENQSFPNENYSMESNSETNDSHKNSVTSEANQISTSNESICSLCKIIAEDTFKIDVTKLNYLCNFIFTRIRNWLPANITDGIAPPPPEPWHVAGDNIWRGRFLLYKQFDLRAMELKARMREYTSLNEICSDILSIKHNVAVYHGNNSTELQAVDYMLYDACHDIEEIRQCVDCYQNSNEKKNRRWFCIPCNPPHELVWAKQKGFSYWPAKVIKKLGKQYDVRFFGAKYLRAVIDQNFIKPINVPLMNLKIKRSPAFNKAYEELLLHQEWLRCPAGIDKFITDSPRKKTIKIRKLSLDDEEIHNRTKRSSSIDEKIKKKRKSLPVNASSSEMRETRAKSSLNKPIDLNKSNSSAITISDAEEDITNLIKRNQSQDDVISSTQDIRYHSNLDISTNSPENPPTLLGNKNVEAADKLRQQLETCFDREKMIQIACDAVQEQVDKFTEKIRSMVASQTAIISDIKKKQWCYNCEQEAIYHCCWNTSYCSTECQQVHWHADHKRNCRRKRV